MSNEQSTQVTQVGEGNTIPPPKTKNSTSNRIRNWVCVLNNPTTQETQNFETALGKAKKYAAQEEIGENGTHHIQGIVCLNDNKTMSAMKDWLGSIRWHLEPCRDVEASIKYCTKTETRKPDGKQWTKGVPKPLKDPISEPRPWQQEILNLIETEPDNRTVNWFWEENGNTGKTSLAKHICMKKNALYVSGKGADVKHTVSEWIEKNGEIDVIIWDLPRTMEEYVSYTAIEELKNGIFHSGKYESKMVIFNSPHVIIFANFPPRESALSADRWKIKRI